MTDAYGGIRVLDFTQGIAGPMACGLLAQFGADVVKIEGPGGDRMREHPGYVAWNCNKRLIALDVKSGAGREEARRLLAAADVVVFDNAPGELDRLGFDAASLTSQYPRLIQAWLPMYGVAGRWSQVTPEDSLLAAATCIAFAQSSWEDVPVHLVTPQLSYGHGSLAAGAIGAALFERWKSGLGQAIVCSGVHGYSAVRTGGAIHADGMIRMGAGRGSRGGSPNYRLYQCGDGEWLFLGTLTMPFFLRALTALDLLDLLTAEGVEGELTNLQKPPANLNAMERLEARFAEKPRAEWLRILHEHGVPVGPVGERGAWFEGEQVRVNEMRVELDHPVYGTVAVPGVSAKLSETPGRVNAVMRPANLEEVRQAPRADDAGLAGQAGHDASRGPLAGIRVLDLGAVIAGPFGPTILANYGADVIKVEPPEGDSFRTAALGFAGWNRGKRSVVLDLKSDEGREAFYGLVREADVVVDNFRLGVTERLRIGYEALSAINPRIITCSVMGYGPRGPFATDPGFDPLLQAQGGLMAAQGGDDEPVFHTIPVHDEASGLMAAFAIVSALNAREQTGHGQEVWTSLTNQSVVTQSGEVTCYEGRPPAPLGGRDCVGVSALQRFYECADGWLAIACTTPKQFAALCEALGEQSWRKRWDGEPALAEPRDGELAEALASRCAGANRDAMIELLLSKGVPVVAAIRSEEAFEDEWLKANGFWEEYELPGHGTVSGVRSYAEFSRTPGGFTRPAPLLGEHTGEVLGSHRKIERANA
jgi:crotonobetainyl-CoA:carnitine CoA-transferase CaiB-like acyl-CoA transferase